MEKKELVEKIHGNFLCIRLAIVRIQEEVLELTNESYNLLVNYQIVSLRKHLVKMEKKLKSLKAKARGESIK